jgi:hypothetical protein
MHSHSEHALQTINNLIEHGLHNDVEFSSIIEDIARQHEILNRSDIVKLNGVIEDYICKLLERHMTRTLREGIETLLLAIESRFHEPCDKSFDEEI